jgi:hypothetical protein
VKQFQLLFSLGMVGAVSVLISQPAFGQVVEVTTVELNPTQNELR